MAASTPERNAARVVCLETRRIGSVLVYLWNPRSYSCASCGVLGWGFDPEGPHGWRLGSCEEEHACGECEASGEAERFRRRARAEPRVAGGRT